MNRIRDKQLSLSAIAESAAVRSFCLQITAAVCGYLATRAEIIGQMHPFGIAVAAGVDSTYYISATIGAAIGCLSFPSGMLFRHIAALFAIISIRYLLYKYEPKSGRPIWSAVMCLGVTVLTGAVSAATTFVQSMPIFAEGIIAGCTAFFVAKSGGVIPQRLHRPNEAETAGALVLLNIVLMGLYSFSIYSLSPGRLLAITLILAAGRYGKTGGGAISGTTAAVVYLLSGGEAIGSITFALAGVMAGLFWSLPRIAAIVAVLLSTSVVWLGSGDFESLLPALGEAAAGSIVFLLLPKRLCVVLSSIFAPPPSTPTLEGMQYSIRSRLHNAAQAIYDVTHTVDEVSARLKEINSPSFEQAVSAVEKDACSGCCLRLECWETKRSVTISKLVNACSIFKSHSFSPDILNEKYEMGCLRPIQVADALKAHYADYSKKIEAEERLEGIRGIVSDQFCGISDMLYELSTEFAHKDCFDTSTAAQAAEALEDIGISVAECGCLKDKQGRLSFEIKIPMISENINRADIVATLGDVCGRHFAPPKVVRGDDYLLLTVNEEPTLTAEVGLCQIPEGSPTAMCGDSANHFFDSKGRLYMVLSDGMGSGGRAAVDGALLSGLLSRMIGSGFSADCSLKISNSAMLFRSSDESMATADITSIDLFDGTVDMHKAGAAPTLVRKKGRTGKAESRSLPAGILRDISFDHAAIQLDDGDIVLMMSDGAATQGTDWICAELERWGDGSAAALANKIADGAARRRDDGHADDITVMAAILHSC